MRVFLISGSDLFLKEEALDRIKENILPGRSREFNFNIFYAEEADRNFLDELNTAPFLNDKKLILIKNTDKLSAFHKERLLDYAKKPASQTYLILETDQISPEDSFLSQISRYSEIIKCDKLYGQRLYSWIYKRLEAYKKKISKEAADLLLELKGNDLQSLAMELEKLSLYTGAKPQISEEDVKNLVGRSIVYDVFDLVDAISQRDYQKSLVLYSLLTSGKKREVEVIGLLGWQFRRMLKGRELQKKNIPDAEIGRILKIPHKYMEKFFNQLRYFEIDKIKKNLKILLYSDRDIKTGKKTKLVLEIMIMKLCGA